VREGGGRVWCGGQPSVRTGLNKLFYSIYARNADTALQALVLMGVLVRIKGVMRIKGL
jgi:hypothetical protein